MLDPALTVVLFDAAGDPTGTFKIRAAFRRAGKLRLRQLRAAMRQAVIGHDLLGRRPDSPMSMHSPATLMGAFNSWFGHQTKVLLASNWYEPFIWAAWRSGLTAACRECSRNDPTGGPDKLLQLTRQELDGIVGAIVQQVSRAAMPLIGQAKGHTAKAWFVLIKTFDKVAVDRINALANTMTVAAHNSGKIAAYRSFGVTHVGVTPERLPVMHDESPGKLLAGVRTAGDFKVCVLCEDYADGAPYSLDAVEAKLPLHANCRCSWYPWHDKRFKHDSNTPREGIPNQTEGDEDEL